MNHRKKSSSSQQKNWKEAQEKYVLEILEKRKLKQLVDSLTQRNEELLEELRAEKLELAELESYAEALSSANDSLKTELTESFRTIERLAKYCCQFSEQLSVNFNQLSLNNEHGH